MSINQNQRLEKLSGVAFAILFGGGSGLTLVGSPPMGGVAGDIQNYFIVQQMNVYWGGVLSMLSVPFLIWFSGYLWAVMGQDKRIKEPYSLIAFGSGIAGSALVAGEVMTLTVGAIRVQSQATIEPEIAAILYDLSTAIGGIALPVALTAMFIAVGVSALQSGVLLSKRAAVATITVGFLAAFIPLSSAMFFICLLWIAMLSVVLYRGSI